MRLIFFMASLTLILSGCTTTQTLDAASIEYHLPRTDASTSLDLVLSNCKPVALDPAASLLTLTAVAGAQDRTFRITGDTLGSSRMARTMKVGLSDKGVITSINAGATDKTTQIIGDIVKIATSFAPAALDLNAPPPPQALTCNSDTAQAVERYQWLSKEIAKLRAQIADAATSSDHSRTVNENLKRKAQAANAADAGDYIKTIKLVNAYAAEAAALRTGDGPLHLVLSKDIDLGDTRPSFGANGASNLTMLEFDGPPFEKWFNPAPTSAQIAAFFGLQWKVTLMRPSVTVVDLGGATHPRACHHSMPLPKVETIELLVKPSSKEGSLLRIPSVADGRKVVAAIAQWQEPAQLCTDVGFGENRNIALSYDAFGRTTGLEWSSDAQAANVTAALAGMSGDAASFVSTWKGAALARQKAEIDELSTQQALNQWRACKEILAQGGYACPQPGSTP